MILWQYGSRHYLGQPKNRESQLPGVLLEDNFLQLLAAALLVVQGPGFRLRIPSSSRGLPVPCHWHHLVLGLAHPAPQSQPQIHTLFLVFTKGCIFLSFKELAAVPAVVGFDGACLSAFLLNQESSAVNPSPM